MNKAETFDHLESSVAIIGLSGRFPGARDITQFWRNLCDGVEAISFFSEQELLSAGVSPDLMSQPEYVRAGGVLEEIEMFDASFFGFSRTEAEITDPQQRLFLEHAWEALETAGYNPDAYKGRIGVFAGVGLNLYLLDHLYPNREIIQSMGKLQIIIQNDKDFLATRTSYKLNLGGPSVVVQSACSTSLLAVHLACQSLLCGESDMALAGGVAVRFLKKTGYLYQEGGIASPDGHCRAFDARGQGTVGGDGVGIVVLKRLADALADHDSILVVIRGSAVNNDGALKAGYTAPSVDRQAEVIAEAQLLAGVEAETIGYIEAHGTATPMGDPIEMEALIKCFRAQTARKRFCAVGSVKTNVGHLDTAAGVTGLIKTALALHHKLIPPSLHFERPNPEIDFENSPFYINSRLAEWPAGRTPRRAGVSSFGIGGTNVHMVLEEAPVIQSSAARKSHHLLVFSAKTDSALEAMTANLARHLKQHPETNLADAAYTHQVGRKRFGFRRMVIGSDAEAVARAIESGDSKRVKTLSEQRTEAPVVFMFPGQGAQSDKMGQELYQSEPKFRENIDLCAELLKPELGLDIRDVLYGADEGLGPATGRLEQTSIAQPAIFSVEYALAKLWMEWDVHPRAMIGHSLGEYVAACLAGVLSLEDSLSLVAARGRLMQELPAGSMLAVALSEVEVRPLLDCGLSLAAVNGPYRCVISGSTPAIDRCREKLERAEVECRLLHTSHAFHSEMMEPILAQFAQCINRVKLGAPQIPYLSNVTGKWITSEEAASTGYWLKHIRQPLRFADGVSELFKHPAQILLEVGPGQTLSALVKQQKERGSDQVILSSLPHPRDGQSEKFFLLTTLGQLWMAGAEIDWDGFYGDERPRRIALPTYPFERKRYWIEPGSVIKPENVMKKAPIVSGLGSILQQQIGIMSQQLDVLRKGPPRQSRLIAHPAAARPAGAAEAIQASVDPESEPGPAPGLSPLTPIQHWFFEQSQPDAHHWNHSVLLEVTQPVNPHLLGRVFKELLAHHDALRLRFKRQGSSFRQIHAGVDEEIPFTRIELPDVSGDEIKRLIEAKATALQTSLDLSEGPLMRVAYFDLGPRKNARLLIIIHHLAIDLLSWQILLEDLNTAYQQASRGEEIRLPSKMTSFKRWAERLADYAQSDQVKREAREWIADSPAAARLPVDGAGSANTANTVGSACTLSWSLNVEKTQSLLERAARVYRTQTSAVLLAALAVAFSRWTEERTLLVDLEGHGRESIFDDVDVSRTVGWFTAIYPVLLDAGQDGKPEQALELIKRRIHSMADGGVGYGVLRYLTEDREISARMRSLPRAEVCFNYWGRFDRLPSHSSLFVPAGEPVGPNQSLSGIRPYLIEINGMIRKGRLQIDWTYSQNLHRRSSVEEVAVDCLHTLESWASLAPSTPPRDLALQ